MSMVKSTVADGLYQARQVQPGDVLLGGDIINSSLTTAGSGTITAAQLTAGILSRTGPGGAYTDTTDTSANIINAMIANSFVGTGAIAPVGIQAGTTFRLRYINTVAFAMTLAAGTGVTLGSNVNVSASSTKEYLVTVTNGTPQQVFAANTTNSSAVITGMTAAQTALVTPGMLVSGTNIPASTTVLSVQPGVGVTLSNNATGTGSNIALTFNPTLRIDSLGQTLL